MRVALPGSDDHHSLTSRRPQVIDVERHEFRETQPGVEEYDDDRPVPRPRALRDPEQPPLLLQRDRARRALGQLFPARDRAPEPELRVEV
jgi:hypothetical protein